MRFAEQYETVLQNVGPCRPEPAEQNPKYPILDSRPRARICSFEHAQLPAQCENLKTKVVAVTEEGAETGEESSEKVIMSSDLWHRNPCQHLLELIEFASRGVLVTHGNRN